MTKISRAYVVKTEWGENVWIEGRMVRAFKSDDVGAAQNLCNDLNAWRESYIHPVDLINMERAQNNQEKP